MLKKISAVIAAALLAAACAGCSDTKGEKTKDLSAEASKGRYVEEDIQTEELWNAGEFANSDDTCFADVSFVGEGNMGRKHILGDGAFTAEDMSIVLPDGIEQMYDGVISPEGDIFTGCIDSDGNFKYLLVTKDGECRLMEQEKDQLFFSYEFSADGRLFLISGDYELMELDTSTLELKKLCTFDESPDTLDIVGDLIFCTSVEGISVYDISTNTMKEPDSALVSLWKQVITDSDKAPYDIFAGSDNDLYLVCQYGIYRHTIGGNITEQIVDGLYNSLGSADDTVRFGRADKDGSFYISFMNGEIRHYRYDPDAVNEFISTLDIYTLNSSQTLSAAVRAFTKVHPEIKIDLNIGMKDGMTYEDAVKELTAQIMSGNAPDLIMLDGLDKENLEEKGMLLDLSEIRTQWQPQDELFTNITEYNSDGVLYSVACRYAIPVVMGKKEQLGNSYTYDEMVKQSLESYSKKGGVANEEEYEPESFANEYTELLTQLYGNKMIKDGKPDEAAIKEYLESTKELISKPCLGVYCFENEYDANAAVNDATVIATGMADNAADMCYSVNALEHVTSVRDEREECDTILGLPDNPNTFRPVCELGICASGENRDAAAEFIKTMLSDEVQYEDTSEGLPVNCESLDKQLAKYDDTNMTSQVMMVDDKGMELMFTVRSTDEEERAMIKSYISGADTPVRLDAMTESAVNEAGACCLNGDISPDEAAARIRSKLELKMKE